jgi:PST family polysaccharide transporter
VTVAAYLIGLKWGPFGVISSLAIISLVIRLPIVYYIAGRRGPVSTSDLWAAFLSHLPCWGTVYAATMLVRMTVEHRAPILQLLVCVPVGLAIGAAGMLMFQRPRQSASYAWRTVRTSLAEQLG